jgi:hypothetical protein
MVNRSVIDTIIRRCKLLSDHPDLDRVGDSILLGEYIHPAIAEAEGEILMCTEDQVICFLAIDIDADTRSVILPPCVGRVYDLSKIADTTGTKTHSWRPSGETNLFGPGWYIEQNSITFRPYPTAAETWAVMYFPSGSTQMHKGTCTVNSATQVTLGATPTVGELGTRDQEYVGQTFRLIQNGFKVQERIIATYDTDTRVATFRNPLIASRPADAAPNIGYEIAPRATEQYMSMVAAKVALMLGPSKEFSEKKMRGLEFAYMQARKSIIDQVSAILIRQSKAYDRATYDAARAQDPTGYLFMGSSMASFPG